MTYWLLCLAVFLSTYLLNMVYISVFYHRGLTHGAVELRPWLKACIVHTGNWVTGLDPKGWACMHRMHHEYSDTPSDPHSPVYLGVFPVLLGQLHSYNRTLIGLIKGKEPYVTLVKDLNFSVSWLNRYRVWYLPYLAHLTVFLVIGFGWGAWLLGAGYFVGMMSHPLQGWMVNALAHKYGYRNFDTPDNSRNNTLVAWLVAGEGFQNNHHKNPASARFAARWWEFDFGYVLCILAQAGHLLRINRAHCGFKAIA